MDPVLVRVVAVAAPGVVAWLLSLLREEVVNTNAALVLVLVVVAVGATGQRLAGVLAAVSSTVWFDVFLAVPYHRLTIADPRDVETAVLLVVVGLAVTEVALWGRRQQGSASRRQGYLDGVVAAARLAASGEGRPGEVVEQVGRQIADVLGVDDWRFEEGPGPGNRPTLLADGRVSYAGRELRVDRSGMPTMDFVELPVTAAGVVLGRYLLSSAGHVARPDREQRRVAVTLADQVGIVMGRPGRLGRTRAAGPEDEGASPVRPGSR